MEPTIRPGVQLAIFGTGGHAREVAWIAESLGYARCDLVFLVDPAFRTDARVNGIDVVDFNAELREGLPCIVAIGDPMARASVRSRCANRGLISASLIAAGATLHDSVVLGEGVVIAPGVIVTVNVTLADDVHINVGASVSHDVRIGKFSTVSPGARVAGHVTIGDSVFIGAGATIINGKPGAPLVIGDGATIAAGACVVDAVAPGSVVMGVPARART